MLSYVEHEKSFLTSELVGKPENRLSRYARDLIKFHVFPGSCRLLIKILNKNKKINLQGHIIMNIAVQTLPLSATIVN